MRLPRYALPAGLSVALLLAGCGGANEGGGGGAQAAGSSSASSSSAASSSLRSVASSSSPAAAWGHMAGCPSVGRQIPAGTHSAPTVDVDGDGRPDTAWIATAPAADGSLPFGIRTASGGVFAATIRSASPVARSVLFADVTGSGEVIALASDGRQVLLYAVSDCSLVPMQNVQGQQYAFDLGFTGYGTGVGCADANGDGTRDLLGLKLITDAQGHPQSIQRTIIELHGPQARNGPTSTVPVQNQQEAQVATAITCGSLTMAANGVTSGP